MSRNMSRRTRDFVTSVALAWSLAVVVAGVAGAEQVVFTEPTAIGCGDTTWDGFDVVVDGTVVSIDCEHAFASLTIRNGGLVLHTPGQLEGMTLAIAGDLVVDDSSDLDATGAGYGPATGPGAGSSCDTGPGSGAGHGGLGGSSATFGSGAAYGLFEAPAQPGSGGGLCGAGGFGGGLLRFTIGGTLDLDGVISANGQAAIGEGGGGSGGTIVVTCAMLTGDGIVRAVGGAAGTGGGGAGGRIVVRADDAATFTGTIIANGGGGGANATAGGAGSVLVERAGFPARLLYDNADLVGGLTEVSGHLHVDGDIQIRAGAIVTHPPAQAYFQLEATRDVIIADDGAIDVSGLGFAAASGPGAGSDCDTGPGGGGGHGGTGGGGSGGKAGGAVNGTDIGPCNLGSGGGVCGEGGAGGGSVRITAGRNFVIEGILNANGMAATGTGGGGAGGSILVQTMAFIGAGALSADGGAGSNGGGGGAGGRIAVYRPCAVPQPETFTGTITVDGGTGFEAGAPGTIFPTMTPSGNDCNGNLSPDECDIGDGTSADRNGNGVPDECEITLALTIDNFVGGQAALFTVTQGPPGEQVLVAWSNQIGRFATMDGSWCVDFWMQLPANTPRTRIVTRGSFDGTGAFAKSIDIPASYVGRRLQFQAARRGTCPGVGMSNVVDVTVQ